MVNYTQKGKYLLIVSVHQYEVEILFKYFSITYAENHHISNKNVDGAFPMLIFIMKLS